MDRQIAELAIVARSDDVADLSFALHEDDAAAIDARDLGDATDDGVKDVAEVERRRERLRKLEDDFGVVFAPRKRVDVLAERDLAADARDELGRFERLSNEVVSAHLERARNLFFGVDARQDDDRNFSCRFVRSEDSKDGIPIGRRHHQIEKNERSLVRAEPRDRLFAGAHGFVSKARLLERSREDEARERVVVHDKERAIRRQPTDRTRSLVREARRLDDDAWPGYAFFNGGKEERAHFTA